MGANIICAEKETITFLVKYVYSFQQFFRFTASIGFANSNIPIVPPYESSSPVSNNKNGL